MPATDCPPREPAFAVQNAEETSIHTVVRIAVSPDQLRPCSPPQVSSLTSLVRLSAGNSTAHGAPPRSSRAQVDVMQAPLHTKSSKCFAHAQGLRVKRSVLCGRSMSLFNNMLGCASSY